MGGSVTAWGRFAASGAGQFASIDGTMSTLLATEGEYMSISFTT